MQCCKAIFRCVLSIDNWLFAILPFWVLLHKITFIKRSVHFRGLPQCHFFAQNQIQRQICQNFNFPLLIFACTFMQQSKEHVTQTRGNVTSSSISRIFSHCILRRASHYFRQFNPVTSFSNLDVKLRFEFNSQNVMLQGDQVITMLIRLMATLISMLITITTTTLCTVDIATRTIASVIVSDLWWWHHENCGVPIKRKWHFHY